MQPRLYSADPPLTLGPVQESTLKRPPDTDMAPFGFIRINGYEQNRDGKSVLVHSYIRRLPAKYASRLLKQNILHFYWQSSLQFPPLNDIVGFEGKGSEYDRAIQFWLDFWSKKGILPRGIDPLLIKALISLESGFDPSAEPPQEPGKERTAAGLMQVLTSSRRTMNGEPFNGYREIRKNLLILRTRDDLFDPIVNIAAGIRWLAHKYAILPKGTPKTIRNMIKTYKTRGKGGEAYAKEVFSRYERSK